MNTSVEKTEKNEVIKLEFNLIEGLKTEFKTFNEQNGKLLASFKTFSQMIKATEKTPLLKRLIKDFNPYLLYGTMNINEIVLLFKNDKFNAKKVENLFKKYVLIEDKTTFDFQAEKLNSITKNYFDTQLLIIEKLKLVTEKTQIQTFKLELQSLEIETVKSIFDFYLSTDKKVLDKVTKTTAKKIFSLSEELFKTLKIDSELLKDNDPLIEQRMKLAQLNDNYKHLESEYNKKRIELNKLGNVKQLVNTTN
jgi:hypothetical protein